MRRFIFLLFALHICNVTLAQESATNQLKEDVAFLASDELRGRETGTEGAQKAADYIAYRMKKIGLKPLGSEGYFQLFSVTPKSNPHATEVDSNIKAIEGKNVIGFRDNGAVNTIVIGAHYDHLGMGGEGSLHAEGEAIHNGADDNASGVGLMLQLATILSAENDNFSKSNYLFIAFSGEEKGLWGSNYFCKNPTLEIEKINYMLNFDMVGRFQSEKGLAINGVGTSPAWKGSIATSNKKEIKLILGESGVGPSDHTSFYLVDLPVLHFFTGQHEDYHKPTDDVEKVNFDGIQNIAYFILNLITETGKSDKLEFTKTKDESKASPRFTVTLGVMPDYMFQGDGMRIDGVTEGKPAFKAGFEKGDIVVQMGEMKVDGMQTYMEALSKYKKGDSTSVKVKRGEEIIETKLEF